MQRVVESLDEAIRTMRANAITLREVARISVEVNGLLMRELAAVRDLTPRRERFVRWLTVKGLLLRCLVLHFNQPHCLRGICWGCCERYRWSYPELACERFKQLYPEDVEA